MYSMDTSESPDDSLLSHLDWKSQEILQALAEAGGQATTTELRERTHIDNNDHITHRYERASVALAPNGLIEVHDSEDDSNQRNPTYEVTLTEKGTALAERLSERGSSASLSLEERVERIEQRLDQLDDAEFGAWSESKQEDHKMMEQGTRTMRDFLLDNYGTRFKEFVAKHRE